MATKADVYAERFEALTPEQRKSIVFAMIMRSDTTFESEIDRVSPDPPTPASLHSAEVTDASKWADAFALAFPSMAPAWVEDWFGHAIMVGMFIGRREENEAWLRAEEGWNVERSHLKRAAAEPHVMPRLATVLAAEHRDQYETDAQFQQWVDTLEGLLPLWVNGLAVDAFERSANVSTNRATPGRPFDVRRAMGLAMDHAEGTGVDPMAKGMPGDD